MFDIDSVHWVYIVVVSIVLVGALNWGILGVFNVNVIEYLNEKTFDSKKLLKAIYIIIGITGLFLLFDRDFFLPFLGNTVLPPTIIKEMQQEKFEKIYNLDINKKTAPIGDNTRRALLDAGSATHIIYWAAEPRTPGDHTIYGPKEAYGKYSNSGIAKINGMSAQLLFRCPQNYKVPVLFGLFEKILPKHIHYRLVYSDGRVSRIETINVEKECADQ